METATLGQVAARLRELENKINYIVGKPVSILDYHLIETILKEWQETLRVLIQLEYGGN